MKEFIEKLIGRLEEKENETVLKAPNTSDISNTEYQKWMMKSYGFKESIEIVNELAEEYKSKTQADKIRLMSDEELAEFFNKFDSICGMCSKNIGCFIVNTDRCKNNILEYLQSEAE